MVLIPKTIFKYCAKVVILVKAKNMGTIEGGYVIQARKTDNSEIAHKPPHFREIFNWLYRQANHQENDKLDIKRGQCFRSIKDVQEGLSWYIGYRKQIYSKANCEKALKYLRKAAMIVTTKSTRGMLITICNYDFYQDPKNYESNKKSTTKATRSQQEVPTINKNDKNEKNNKILFGEFVFLTEEEHKKLIDKYESEFVEACVERLDNYLGSTGKKYKSHYRTILSWVASAEMKTGDWLK